MDTTHITQTEIKQLAETLRQRLFSANALLVPLNELIDSVNLLNTLRSKIEPPKGWSLKLTDRGQTWIDVIKTIRTLLPGKGLAEAKALTENLPKIVIEDGTLKLVQDL